MKIVIVIPARFGSKRFPGKPLAELNGKTILERVWQTAQSVCNKYTDCTSIVATEEPDPSEPHASSQAIIDFCHKNDITVKITPSTCKSGTDRCLAVFDDITYPVDRQEVVINLQGDNPLCPPIFLMRLIDSFDHYPQTLVATPYVHLTWESLDALRIAKQDHPFSGTTVTVSSTGNALWFSKQIIPGIRSEKQMRADGVPCPVCRHIGLYAYRFSALEQFCRLPQSRYESLEQLEQLRFLENGIPIRMAEVQYPLGYEMMSSGIDSPEDLVRASKLINTYGELEL